MKIKSVAKITLASFVVTSLATIGQLKAAEPHEKLLVQTTEQSTYEVFRSFIQKTVGNPNYRVSYDMELPNNPNTMITQWFKGDKFRIDTQMEGRNTRMYHLGEETTTCMNQGGSWRCFQMPQTAETPKVGTRGVEKLEDAENNLETYRNRITKIDSRTVAGEKTSCFRVDEPEENQYWISCYSNNHGIPLYMEGESSEGTWKMTATDFQPSVSDDDFKLPAEPQSIPNMPGGF